MVVLGEGGGGVHEDEKSISSNFLYCSPICEQDSSLNLELADWLGWLASKLWRSSCLHFPALELQVCSNTPGFCMDDGDPNSGPQTYTKGTLHTEPSPPLLCLNSSQSDSALSVC